MLKEVRHLKVGDVVLRSDDRFLIKKIGRSGRYSVITYDRGLPMVARGTTLVEVEMEGKNDV